MKRAFTRVELTFVSGMVALLTVLLFPAVQHAREAGLRAKCASNLHQAALELHEYFAAHPRALIPEFERTSVQAGEDLPLMHLRCPKYASLYEGTDGENGVSGYEQPICCLPIAQAAYERPLTEIIILRDVEPIHDGLREAMFLDGHVDVQ
jgi:hypothetical protein